MSTQKKNARVKLFAELQKFHIDALEFINL